MTIRSKDATSIVAQSILFRILNYIVMEEEQFFRSALLLKQTIATGARFVYPAKGVALGALSNIGDSTGCSFHEIDGEKRLDDVW